MPLIAIVGFLAALAAAACAQTICIDPGHPSEAGRGTRGRRLTEIEAAWSVAKELERSLVRRGYRVLLTKGSPGEFKSNPDRAGVANRSNADLLLRLHCDAAGGSGVAVYYPNRTGARGSTRGPSRATIARSKSIAEAFHRALVRQLAGIHPDRGLKTDGHTKIGGRQGALTGSIYAKVPVILVEMAVLTNPRDERFLAEAGTRAKFVGALAAAVLSSVPPKVLAPGSSKRQKLNSPRWFEPANFASTSRARKLARYGR